VTDDALEDAGAEKLIQIIKREFKGVDRQISAEELARLYGVIAAQHEANLACFALAMKANPSLVFTDAARDAEKAIQVSVEALVDALRDLALSSMTEEDRAKAEAEDE
jgi:hypothetical protein